MRQKREPSVTVAYTILCFGAITFTMSIVYTASIPAFIGLGLTFWGALLLFIKPKKYVQFSLLNSIAISSLETIDRIIGGLGYAGKAVYLPPKYSEMLEKAIVFVPFDKNVVIPPLKRVAEGETRVLPMLTMNPKGIFLRPPGLRLTNLYERELGKDFTKVDLLYLHQNLPQLFVEDLEMADDLQMTIEGNLIQVRITGSVFKDFCSEAMKLSHICGSIGCHLCSSIAIALTRASGKPITIEETDVSEDRKVIEVHYKILEE